jgi:8-oxo-dGTP pyrophosphatase MutT (NUDIX family)
MGAAGATAFGQHVGQLGRRFGVGRRRFFHRGCGALLSWGAFSFGPTSCACRLFKSCLDEFFGVQKIAAKSETKFKPVDKKSKNSEPRQFGALAYREREGGLEVLLISSRETRRWVLPKGWPMKGVKPHHAAAREAMEEAGLVGSIGKAAIGSFTYDKKLDNGSALKCEVTVYPMKVNQELERWPEANERTRRWFSIDEAAEAVEEPDLRELLVLFAERKMPSGSKIDM